MKSTDIEQEIELTLGSIENITKADAPTFLYSKLQQRISKEKSLPVFSLLVYVRPAISVAALFIFLVLNGFAISKLWQQKQQASTPSSSLQSFAREYDLGISTAYEQ